MVSIKSLRTVGSKNNSDQCAPEPRFLGGAPFHCQASARGARIGWTIYAVGLTACDLNHREAPETRLGWWSGAPFTLNRHRASRERGAFVLLVERVLPQSF